MDSTLAAALIGVSGTLAVAMLGYRRWAREHEARRREPYEDERRELYRELWRRAEGISVALRRTSIPPSEFAELLGDLNEFMLTNGLHIQDEHRVKINEYMMAVQAFHRAVLEAGADIEIRYGETQDIPPSVSSNLEDLGAAQVHAKALKQELFAALQPIVAGGR
jgi:hypothetical protein